MNGERQKRKAKGSEILFLSSFEEIKVHRREVPIKKGTSLPMEKDISLFMEKGTQNIIYCLFIVCENHRFQDPVISYN